MCQRGLFAQCETTQVRSQGQGAALFGYTSLYGSVPGGQAQYLRGYLYLSDILRRPASQPGVDNTAPHKAV
jgi:threonine dehydrogenase-like Zn-dependent dehydrogenase